MTCGMKARNIPRIIILLKHAPATTKKSVFDWDSVFGINACLRVVDCPNQIICTWIFIC